MSASLIGLPLDVYSKGIVPYFLLPDILSFGLSSKAAYAIISNIALEPQEDRALNGDRIIIWLDKNIPFTSFVRLHLKREEFDHFPQLSDSLNQARTAVKDSAKDPDNISALCDFAHSVIDHAMMGAILIFDYTAGKLTGPDLGKALEISIPGSICEDTYDGVLFHPNANAIPGYAIVKPLTARIKQTKYSGYVLPSRLLSLPNLKEIPGDNLSELLASAIETKDQDLIHKILALPGINDIPSEGIPEPLEAATLAGNQDLVNILLALSKANTIPERASDGDQELAEFVRVDGPIEDPNEVFKAPATPDASVGREASDQHRNT